MKVLLTYDKYDIVNGDIMNIQRIIFESEGKLYYLSNDEEKIKDVMSSPDYIKLDWFKYNKIPLTIKHIDHISSLISERPILKPDGKIDENLQNLKQTLKSIRRDFVISEVK